MNENQQGGLVACTARRAAGVRRSGVGTGTTSLLMIFTVLCFATLAMLSLSAAASNGRIQKRGLEGGQNLAVAKGAVAEQVAALDEMLLASLAVGLPADGDANLAETYYFSLIEGRAEDMGWEIDKEAHTATLYISMDVENQLVTVLQLLYPENDGPRYEVKSQHTRLAAGWQPEEGGQLWVP